ncbi:MAG: ATP phosphoribosyltransferase regulatory subunit [Beijerinckiaceae bacterium]|nr:ATP phosphoribosyltransferase regulatory subunit [Beijerinckiaceae bacterium]
MPTQQKQDELLALFSRNAYLRAETSLLQPVDLFLDLSGEDIRRRLYLTQDADGHELCLRPEYTIPVARDYLSSGKPGRVAELSYLGPVFRHRVGESGEFVQAGVESFGRADRDAADAQIFTLAFEAAQAMGDQSPRARIGDVALITAVLGALGVDAALHRRLLRALAGGKPHAEALTPPAAVADRSGGLSAYSGVLTALKGTDGSEARAFVKDLLSIAGISSVGGRSAADIAERFLSQAERSGGAMPAESRAVLDRFLAIEGDPDHVSAEMRALAADAGLDIESLLDAYDARIGFMAAQGIDLSALTMQTRFVRNLDYYTSFIFEFSSAVPGKPSVGGGRYDRLLARLGAASDIPAIGFAVWLDRFGGQPA